MNGYELVRAIRERIEKTRDQMRVDLCAGRAVDFSEYRYSVGVLMGLQQAAMQVDAVVREMNDIPTRDRGR